MSESYTVRQLTLDDLELLKIIRLEALQQAHGNFGASYEEVCLKPNSEWEKWFVPTYGVFGLFCGNECIGMTGVCQAKDSTENAALIASYIRKDYRGKGLSRMLYEPRIAWAKEKGYKKLIISHRKSNSASKAANQKFGFVYTHSESKTWPDGITEDNVYYELPL